MAIDYEYFKKKLEEERAELEGQLKEIGIQNPDNPSDWEAVAIDRDTSQADENTVADAIEDLGEHEAILTTLEKRYNDIKSGLDKIKHNTYGLCQVCDKEIEHDRLEANPAARTCKEHM